MTYRILDLFCGAGGAAEGYHRAGFGVQGVDNESQSNYPFAFLQADAMQILQKLIDDKEIADQYDAIHASPMCHKYSRATYRWISLGRQYPDQIPEVRELLIKIGKPYVIENVERAPLIKPIMLCGTMFGLGTIRHRIFESNIKLRSPGRCHHRGRVGKEYVTCVGNGCDGSNKKKKTGREPCRSTG